MSIAHDGHGTTMAWTTNSTFSVSKVKIKTLGIDGGDPIDVSHLGNTTWMTFKAPTLKKVTSVGFTGLCDVSTIVSAPINSEDVITITYGSGAGGGNHVLSGAWLRSLIPGDIVSGQRVEVEGVIEVGNLSGGSETAPAYNAGSS